VSETASESPQHLKQLNEAEADKPEPSKKEERLN
jgi:hypothetical protein